MSQALSLGPGPRSCLDIRILDSNSISVWSGSSVWIRLFAWFDPDLCLDIWILNSSFFECWIRTDKSLVRIIFLRGGVRIHSTTDLIQNPFYSVPKQMKKHMKTIWNWKKEEIDIYRIISCVLFTSLISSQLCLIGWLESKEFRS